MILTILALIITIIITIIVLVVSHEFGHFWAAKKFGIKVLEFGIGLPPKIWGKKKGETTYSVNWLPIGGFVRLLGEDETDKKVLNDPRSFASQPVLPRIIVVVAGVTMNLILAVVLFWIVLWAQGFKEKVPLLTDYKFIGVNQTNVSQVVIGKVAPGSPAELSGIKSGDRITEVNGQKLSSVETLVIQAKQQAGQPIQLKLLDPEDQTRQVTVTPRANPPQGQGALGVELGEVRMAFLDYATPSQRAVAGITHSYNLASYSMNLLGNFIGAAFKTHSTAPLQDTVSGPVGIANLIGTILSLDKPLIPYLNFLALLSLNLAIVNILPFPALDGGRLVFLVIEGVFRRKVAAQIEKYIHAVGMAILITMIVLVTFMDIKKLF